MPEDWDEERLEAALFPANQQSKPASARPLPDYEHMRQQLEQHRELTIELLYEEYREQHPDGYSYSQVCKLYRR